MPWAEMATLILCMFGMKNTARLPRFAEAYFTGEPVAVCGTAGPGVAHLFNGLMDARKERAPVIAIAGDVETRVMDTSSLEEMNPYQFFQAAFQAASLYTARLINPAQAQSVIGTAIRTSIIEKGPAVVSIPGDVPAADAVGEDYRKFNA
jgi:pyruvate dehydrogenase (quinone)